MEDERTCENCDWSEGCFCWAYGVAIDSEVVCPDWNPRRKEEDE